MKYDGAVIKIDDLLYLFLLDYKTNSIKDGINISEHECYKDIKYNQLMVVEVEFKDGTEVIDDIDLDEFIYGDTYGRSDVFLYIKDILLFNISKETDKEQISIYELVENGELTTIITNCINHSKNNINTNE